MIYYMTAARCCYRILKKISETDKFIDIKQRVRNFMTQIDDKAFLTSEDVKEGEQFVIMDEGLFEERNFGTEEDPDVRKLFNITISVHELEFTYSMNRQTRINFLRVLGKDTKLWVGKKGVFNKVRMNVFGKMKDVIYAVPVK